MMNETTAKSKSKADYDKPETKFKEPKAMQRSSSEEIESADTFAAINVPRLRNQSLIPATTQQQQQHITGASSNYKVIAGSQQILPLSARRKSSLQIVTLGSVTVPNEILSSSESQQQPQSQPQISAPISNQSLPRFSRLPPIQMSPVTASAVSETLQDTLPVHCNNQSDCPTSALTERHPDRFNCSEIKEGWLYLGSDIAVMTPGETAVDLPATEQQILQNGFRYIINVADDCADLTQFVTVASLSRLKGYRWLPVKDDPGTNIESIFQDLFETINLFHRQDPVGKILVHCKAGKSRSVTAMMAYLIKSDGMTYEQAYGYVSLRRRAIEPNAGFLIMLKQFAETTLKQI